MKFFVMTLVAICSICQVSAAQDNSDMVLKSSSSELKAAFVDPKLKFGEVDTQASTFVLNPLSQTVILTLVPVSNGQNPVVIELPINQITVDHCGIRTILASQDGRSQDGALETLTVRDNSKYTCHELIEYQPTAGTYNTLSAAGVQTTSHFFATQLQMNGVKNGEL